MKEFLFKRVTIIGFGLIGSSLARAISENDLAEEIICADHNTETCEAVLELGLARQATQDIAAAVEGADLVVICTPLGTYAEIGHMIAPHLGENCIVTDVGSAKAGVMTALKSVLPEHIPFVPGHPIAGGEKSGPRAGDGHIFQNRWCILTPSKGTSRIAVDKVAELWRSCGMMVEEMEAAHHDRVLAITSHVPHLIAYTIVYTATELQEDARAEVIKFSAGGFRDFTRIAASNPVMWRDIFLNNRESVLEMLQRFSEDLTNLQKAIRKGDGDALERMFTVTRDIRRKIIDARQA
jgi:cyclohexadieny/prephenate dehydrogenase